MYVIMKKEIYINIISILTLGIFNFILLINNQTIRKIFNIKNNYLILIMIISLLISIVIIYIFKNILKVITNQEKIILIISYIILLLISLYFRKPLNHLQIENKDYIIKWLSIIFKNKIVFINIIGNICLFIPLGIILTNYIDKIYILLLTSIVIIISLETIQYLSKRGIFDYIDIILNYIGVILGIILNKVKKEKR